MSLSHLVLIFSAALLGGAVNAIAGGGTFFTFSALVATGVPAVSANATSAVAMVPGYVASAWMYRGELVAAGRRSWLLSAISLIGGITGALVLLRLNPHTFDRLVPYLLLAATGVFALNTRLKATIAHLAGLAGVRGGAKRLAALAFQLAVAVYGGFFGAGMGILMLAALLLTEGAHFHGANALKNLLSIYISGVAVLVFISADIVRWDAAAVMILGASLGGFVGIAAARRVPVTMLNRFVIAAGLLLSAYFFFKH